MAVALYKIKRQDRERSMTGPVVWHKWSALDKKHHVAAAAAEEEEEEL